MMKSILEETALGTDEKMAEKASKVLTELTDVKDFHLKSNVQNLWALGDKYRRTTESSEPSRHKASATENFVAPNGADDVVNYRISPLY
jgi:hypothetical protein